MLDSAWTAAGPVYRNCDVDHPAYVENPEQRFDRSYTPSMGCETALLDVVVDTAGLVEPGSVRVVRTNSQALLRSVMISIPRWRYRPAIRGGVPVRQAVEEAAIVTRTRVVSGVPSAPRPSSPGSCLP